MKVGMVWGWGGSKREELGCLSRRIVYMEEIVKEHT